MQIVSTGRALPVRKISNEEISTWVETSDEWIRTRTGIGNRYRCEKESCGSLAVAAGRAALQKSGLQPEEIGAVLVATSTADYAFPSTACLVQKELGLPEDIIAFDISAACTGFLMGMATARGLLTTLEKKYILLIGSEELSKIVDDTDRSTCILFGDGAGAVILTEGQGSFIQRSWSRGNVEVLNCPGTGAAKKKRNFPGSGERENYISMKGNDVFRFAVTALSQAINEVLADAGLTMDDIDLVVCHQANERIIRHVRRQYRNAEDKLYLNIENYGNTSAASIPIAIDECAEQGKIQKDSKILCVGFGAGLTWSGALFLPEGGK